MSEDLQRYLRSRPDEWEFVQVVRALERFTRAEAQARRTADAARAGDSSAARRAPRSIRFRTAPDMGFPASEVESVVSRDEQIGETREVARVWDVAVNFLGLNGACGVLPRSDTGHALYLAGTPNNRAILALFDLVGAPFIALFADAMRRYRAPLQWERLSVAEGIERPGADSLEAALLALLGAADPALRGDEAPRFQLRQLVRLGAAFSAPHRTANGLKSILEALLDAPVVVKQFQPNWRVIPSEDRTLLGSQHARLGRNSVLGGKFCDIAAGVEVEVGPVELPLFLALLPSGRLHAKLADLVAMYAGHHLRVRLRPTLRGAIVPSSRLGAKGDRPAMLGRSAWLAARMRVMDFTETVVPLSSFDEEGCRA